jgi:ATP-dependent DNA helicase PIF1
MSQADFELTAAQAAGLARILAGASCYVFGPAGSGKSVLLRAGVGALRSGGRDVEVRRCAGKSVAVTASTGVAAINVGGETLHGFVHMGLVADKTVEELVDGIERRAAGFVARARAIDALVLDEVSMLSPDDWVRFDAVFRAARRDAQTPFGGLQVVAFGDFCQLAPVRRGPSGTRFDDETGEPLPDYCFQTGAAWRFLELVPLGDALRQGGDPVFRGLLNRMRFAECTAADAKLLNERVSSEPVQGETVLYPHRDAAAERNAEALERLPGGEARYAAATWSSLERELEGRQREAWARLNKAEEALRRDCPAPPELRLRVGAEVMLVTNLDVGGGLANGTRGVVTGFAGNDKDPAGETHEVARAGSKTAALPDGAPLPVVRFRGLGGERTVAPHVWETEVRGAGVACYAQVPLALAWALTVHKAQSLTIAPLAIAPRRFFAPGQAYVAFSRAPSLAALRLLDPVDLSKISADPHAAAYVRDIEAGGDGSGPLRAWREQRVDRHESERRRRRAGPYPKSW